MPAVSKPPRRWATRPKYTSAPLGIAFKTRSTRPAPPRLLPAAPERTPGKLQKLPEPCAPVEGIEPLLPCELQFRRSSLPSARVGDVSEADSERRRVSKPSITDRAHEHWPESPVHAAVHQSVLRPVTDEPQILPACVSGHYGTGVILLDWCDSRHAFHDQFRLASHVGPDR
jgi:hypothetical protein